MGLVQRRSCEIGTHMEHFPKLLSIPRNTHRYFIEPLTEMKHIKFALLKRFVNFVNNLAKSTKMVIKNMLSSVKYECRSTTGHNLRIIMLLVNNTNVDEIRHITLSRMLENGRLP